MDRWSDLDVLLTAAEPPKAAEDLAPRRLRGPPR
jgi:hypothetical protein